MGSRGSRNCFEPTFVELEPNRPSESQTRAEPNFRCQTSTDSSRVELSNFLYKWCTKKVVQLQRIVCV